MYTEKLGPNMNITVENHNTNKVGTIEINHSEDLLQNLSRALILMKTMQCAIRRSLMPKHQYQNGYFICLNVTELGIVIHAFNSLFEDHGADQGGVFDNFEDNTFIFQLIDLFETLLEE